MLNNVRKASEMQSLGTNSYGGFYSWSASDIVIGTGSIGDIQRNMPKTVIHNDRYAEVHMHMYDLELPIGLIKFLSKTRGIIVGDYALDMAMRMFGSMKTIADHSNVEVFVARTAELEEYAKERANGDLASYFRPLDSTLVNYESYVDKNITRNVGEKEWILDCTFAGDDNGPETKISTTVIDSAWSPNLGDYYAFFHASLTILASTVEFVGDYAILKIRNFDMLMDRRFSPLVMTNVSSVQKYAKLGFTLQSERSFKFEKKPETELPVSEHTSFGHFSVVYNHSLWDIKVNAEPGSYAEQIIVIGSYDTCLELNGCDGVVILCEHYGAQVRLVNCMNITIVGKLCRVYDDDGALNYDLRSVSDYMAEWNKTNYPPTSAKGKRPAKMEEAREDA
jgi:hypothetical protein